MDNLTYAMRQEAIEGRIFYENKLAEPDNVRVYFPVTEGEQNYNRRPKISFPVTGEIVDRITSLIYSGLTVTFSDANDESVWSEISERNRFLEHARNMVVQLLSRGCYLTVLRMANGVYWEGWTAEFCQRIVSPFYNAAGYEYKRNKDTNVLSPVTNNVGKRTDDYVSVMIDDFIFIETYGEQVYVTEHNLPFAPFVFARGIDSESSGRYSYPYHKRFKDLLLEYNLTYSQVAKAVRILQNVWVTDKESPNPNFPLRLDPDTINHVGSSGKLEQAVRQLNIEPELTSLQLLKTHISARAQVPDFMTGLDGVGKVESGVALAIVNGPLAELCDRIRPEFKGRLSELIYKSVHMEYQSRGISKENISFEIVLNESVIPADVQKEIDMLIKAKDSGLIPPALIRSVEKKVAALLGLKEELS